MSEITLGRRQAQDDLEYLDEEELSEALEEMSRYIGWVVIYFNSLEGIVSFAITELVSHDAIQDDRMSVFLAEMQYSGKCRALINLYGQIIEYCDVKSTVEDLTGLENLLVECGKRRNEYAHADWIAVTDNKYVCVKTQAKKRGVFERYKKFEITQMQEDIEFIRTARDKLEDFDERINNQLYGRE
jgi:hypothetical protein